MSLGQKQLMVVGCNHDRTPIEVREEIAISKEQVAVLLERLRNSDICDESLVLNTCNRLEVYAVTDKEEALTSIIHEISLLNGFSPDRFREYSYHKEGIECIHHLFQVSAGLDSQLIGETEIFGQVKEAYKLSAHYNNAGKVLHRILQKSFQAGKWARTHTGIGTGQVSIGNISVELASRIFGHLTKAKMLVLGSGEVGQDVAKAFRSRGIGQILVSSRTLENAKALAEEVDGQVVPFKSWSYELALSDIILFATSSPEPILNCPMVEEALNQRKGKSLFLIDLALPRNVEFGVEDIEQCYLYNLDDLSKIASENLENRRAEIERCEIELKERAKRVLQSLR